MEREGKIALRGKAKLKNMIDLSAMAVTELVSPEGGSKEPSGTGGKWSCINKMLISQ